MAFGGELTALAEPALFASLGNSVLTFKEDYVEGKGYANAVVPITLGLGSYATDVPLGLAYSGAATGMAIYMHFVPPPAPLGLGNQ